MSGKTALLSLLGAGLLACGEAPAPQDPAAPPATAPMMTPGSPAPTPSRAAPGRYVRVEPGAFAMGTSPSDQCRRTDNEDRHRVTLTRAFEIAATEVTQGQYQLILGENPSSFQECGADCPADLTDWHHAAAFANAVSAYTGLPACYRCSGAGAALRCAPLGDEPRAIYGCAGYRLPTEAEWELAYRAGTDDATYRGALSTCSELDPAMDAIAWFLRNGEGRIHEVGMKAPNALGLYDMSGNVWEWTHDRYETRLRDAVDPVGVGDPGDPELHPLRGGSFNCLPSESRASHRSGVPGTIAALNVGFRLARTLEPARP